LKTASLQDVDFKKGDGLVPVIAQERISGKVLILAYANPLALKRTLETGFAHYWSRSRQKLWRKGEESGHVQRVLEVLVDCDGDTLIYSVDQTGPACHTGEMTCFFRKLEEKLLKTDGE
jgi:phosphoribosyl-AMP cyclohydrolase